MIMFVVLQHDINCTACQQGRRNRGFRRFDELLGAPSGAAKNYATKI